ncbi:MAG: hypothetical protein RBS43_08255 [Candidatus Cloacimonas sp.]|jgi:hypothetical protein|nr:hypothetical protein [Candidatus Cloacimonas sp.]
MRLDKRRLVYLLLFVFMVLGTVIIAQKQTDNDQYVVKNFQVDDVPSDDGSGLMLSWKPLDRSKRIIEYRVYRGVKPDQLFFLEAIPVNVKTGVASDKMFYYDSSGSEFIDVASPGKLKKEKQQDAKSPLYRKLPRDVPFLATIADKFNLLSLVDKSKFYYSSKKFVTDKPTEAGPDGKIPTEGDVYAGLKSNQQTVLCFLKPGEKYYYTVVAVNERYKYQKPAPIAFGTPVANPPEPAVALHSVLLEDRQEMQFEWEYPQFKDDLNKYRILQVPALSDSAWQKLRQNPEAVQSISTEVKNGDVGSGSFKNYCTASIAPEVSVASYADARYCIELIDYDGFSSFSPLSVPVIKQSTDLPPQAIFHMEDKPNEKGDRITVVWDNPICFVVKTTSLDSEFSRIRINYQLNETETQKVKNIYFEFFKAGEEKSFAKIKEFYQDSKVVLKTPIGYDYKKGFRVKITMEGTPTIPADYSLEQDLIFDDKMLAIMPTKALFRNGLDVSTISNVIYKKALSSSNLTLVKRNTSFDNNLDVTIPYPSTLQKPVYGLSFAKGDSLISLINGNNGMERKARKLKKGDIKTPLVLLSADTDLEYDRKNETRINTNIFPEEAVKQAKEKVEELKTKLTELNAIQGTMPEQQFTDHKETLEKQLAAYTSNEKLLHANRIKGFRKRMHYVAKVREDYSRYASFQVVKTDGKGMFVESPMLKLGDGILYLKPVSEWFDSNKYVTLFATLLFGLMVIIFVKLAKLGKDLYIRPIAGIQEIDNAIGRATEMGRPMMYCMGSGGLADVATIASLGILGLVAKRAAEYDTKLIVPCYDYIVLPIAQEIVREAHYSVGRPDTFDKNSVFYLTNSQFAYVAGVNGIMIRERAATNFFMGWFAAEALLMTETGNTVGAMQIAGTDAVTQVPFFITTCDYTLIGEELYAASAYLNSEPMLLGTLKAQDYFKFIILTVMVIGAVLSTFQITGLNDLLPLK